MKGRSGFWPVVLAIGLALVVLGLTANCAVARAPMPGYKLPGPHCVWFFDWPSSGGDDANNGNGDGEDEWPGPGPDPDDDPDGPEWGMYWWP